MGHIIMVVTVWLVMALPVIAKNSNQWDGPGGGQGPPHKSGFGKADTASDVYHNPEGACVDIHGDTTGKSTGGGCPEVT